MSPAVQCSPMWHGHHWPLLQPPESLPRYAVVWKLRGKDKSNERKMKGGCLPSAHYMDRKPPTRGIPRQQQSQTLVNLSLYTQTPKIRAFVQFYIRRRQEKCEPSHMHHIHSLSLRRTITEVIQYADETTGETDTGWWLWYFASQDSCKNTTCPSWKIQGHSTKSMT